MLTDPLSLALGAVALGLAITIGILQVPRPPALDGERWFKLALCTLLRGRMDAAGATAEAWQAEVVRLVPYHPAGRLPERKISNPVAALLPSAAIEGEVSLLEALAGHATPEARLAYLFDEDVAGREARFANPADLGEPYDFGRLGPGASWDTLADWAVSGTTFAAAAERAMPADWVLVEGRADHQVGPPVLDAIGALLPQARRVAWDPAGLATILSALTGPRLVLVAEEAGVTELLRVLAEDAALRDQVAAVVAIGGVIGGRTDEEGRYGTAACEDWLGAHFDHSTLDTDVVRNTPYFCLQWLDRGVWPPGVAGLPLQAARFPLAAVKDPRMPEIVEVVDLGPLPSDRDLDAGLVARALIAVVSAFTHSRR